ncbi:MAG TPA: DJ-1/PfpI family protein [Pyrinomonadaceae bacterium]|jgi:putative intracellular protease/amidase
MKRLNLLPALCLLVLLGCDQRGAAQTQKAHVPAPPAAANAAAAARRPATRNLAIFIFDGVQIIDYTGPYEVLGHAPTPDGRAPLFNIYTVAAKPGPVTTNMGMTVVPRYSFAEMPKADVLLLPGGNVEPSMNDPAVVRWVQEQTKEAEYVMSVCNGAFFLGKAGLLDGLTATTFHGLIDQLQTLAPKARVVRDQRFVDNGKIITTAGLTSGMDGALHLIEKYVGRGRTQEVALALEYNWQPDVPYARASFADRYLRKVLGREGFKLPEGTGWTVLWQQGGRDAWEKTWEVRLNTTAPELLKLIDAKLAEGWTKVAPAAARAEGGAARSAWRFTDEAGQNWQAFAEVQPVPDAPATFKLSIRLARAAAGANAGRE